MSQTLNSVPAFDGTNYGFWKARMWFFLKSINCWSIVETGWTKPEDVTLELVPKKIACLSNDKSLHTLCQALHHLNLQKFQIANQPKKNGKFWKQHIKALSL
jgi:cytolysin (calcineurin-like family phosphatase)